MPTPYKTHIMARTKPTFLLLTAVLLLSVLSFASPAAAAQEEIEADYGTLLKRAKAEPWTMDFIKLRMAFTKTPEYRPHDRYTAEDTEIDAAIVAGDWTRALDL